MTWTGMFAMPSHGSCFNNGRATVILPLTSGRSFLERCIVSLATNRGLMLIGEPGTARSYLSELLAAAISGHSTLTIQGSAATTEDNIRYSWNYALLVTTFRELRQGKTVDGKGLESLSTVLSTAEAVNTACAAGVHAYYYDDGTPEPHHVVQHLIGIVLKDNPDDLKKVRHYFEHVVRKRSCAEWKKFYDARGELG